jgi:nicotinate-nucleotide adenylyltransferase
MTRVGLYFGSFNPVHIGHTAIGGYLKEFTDLNEIWFIVSPHNPLKKRNMLLSGHHRLYMVELAIGNDDRFRASDIEFRLPAPSYTIDTLARLSEQYPSNQFSLVMGEDNLSTLHKWKNARELVKHHPIYVYPRPGLIRKPNPTLDAILEGAVVKQVNAPMIEISGTFIRNGIKNGKNMSWFLHPAVWKYIQDMHFYE